MHTKSLQAALRSTRAKTRVLPVSERVETCKMFVDRAKKRVQRAQDVVDKALSQKAVHEAEVAEGERRMALLQAEAAQPAHVTELQQQIDALVRERDALRASLFQDGKYTSHAHRPSGFGGLAQPQLRAPERNGVRRRRIGGTNLPQVQRAAADVPVTAATSSSSSPWQTAQKTVDFPQVQFSLGCGRPCAHAGSSSDSVIDKVMATWRGDFSRILLHFSHSVHSDIERRLFGALDGQQLLVVEGSGRGGDARESVLQVFYHMCN